jgi:hypothetical protein
VSKNPFLSVSFFTKIDSDATPLKKRVEMGLLKKTAWGGYIPLVIWQVLLSMRRAEGIVEKSDRWGSSRT